jgi:hypothetical protein
VSRRRGAVLVLAVAVAAVLGVRVWQARKPGGDFFRYWNSGRALLEGETRLYDRPVMNEVARRASPEAPDDPDDTAFKYLPVFAVLWQGPALLPVRLAEWLWQLANLAFAAAIVAWSWRLAFPGGGPWWTWALPLALTARLFWNNLNYGQINVVVLFLGTLALRLVDRERDARAGGAAALGGAIKFTPAFLIPYFALKRRFLAAAAGLVALAALIVGPALQLGWARNLELLREYVGGRGGMVSEAPERMAGESVAALAWRLLTPMEVKQTTHPVVRINVASLPAGAVHTGWLVASAAVLLGVAWLARGPLPRPAGPALAAEAGALFAAILVISPEARAAHFIALTLAACALCAQAHGASSSSARRFAIVALAASFVLLVLPTRGLVGKDLAFLAGVWCASGIAAALMLAALVAGKGVRTLFRRGKGS